MPVLCVHDACRGACVRAAPCVTLAPCLKLAPCVVRPRRRTLTHTRAHSRTLTHTHTLARIHAHTHTRTRRRRRERGGNGGACDAGASLACLRSRRHRTCSVRCRGCGGGGRRRAAGGGRGCECVGMEYRSFAAGRAPPFVCRYPFTFVCMCACTCISLAVCVCVCVCVCVWSSTLFLHLAAGMRAYTHSQPHIDMPVWPRGTGSVGDSVGEGRQACGCEADLSCLFSICITYHASSLFA